MKDNLIDEERAKQEEAAQESTEQKLERLGKFFFYRNIMFTRIDVLSLLHYLANYYNQGHFSKKVINNLSQISISFEDFLGSN